MRRQGYEFAVSRPKVIFHKDANGNVTEPIEELTIDVPTEYVGAVMEKLGQRKAELTDMANQGENSVRLQFLVPARGLMGYRSELLTDTRGNGVMSHIFHDYEPYKGPIEERKTGSLVAHETGDTSSYGLFNTQDRGKLFRRPASGLRRTDRRRKRARRGHCGQRLQKKKARNEHARLGIGRSAPPHDPPLCLRLSSAWNSLRTTKLVEGHAKETPHAQADSQ
jgi:GTP-binding protein